MKKAPHIILGVTKNASDKVELLKKSGEKEVYVLDINQSDRVKEKDGVMYISEEVASNFLRNHPEIVFHLYKPNGQKRNK